MYAYAACHCTSDSLCKCSSATNSQSINPSPSAALFVGPKPPHIPDILVQRHSWFSYVTSPSSATRAPAHTFAAPRICTVAVTSDCPAAPVSASEPALYILVACPGRHVSCVAAASTSAHSLIFRCAVQIVEVVSQIARVQLCASVVV